MKTTNYNVRLNPEVKAKAEKTFALFGMNLSDAINIFLHKAILERGLPFEVAAPRKYKPEVYELIDRIESGEEEPVSYSSLDEFFADMNSEDDDDE